MAVLVLFIVGNFFVMFKGLSIPKREIAVVWLAGCIRGTIAYALILKAVPRQQADMNQQEVIMISTVLGIVLSNCLLVGTIFPLVIRILRLQSMTDGMNDVERMPSGVAREVARMRERRLPQAVSWGWRSIDDSYLKPLLRPKGWEAHDAIQEVLAETREQVRDMFEPVLDAFDEEAGDGATEEVLIELPGRLSFFRPSFLPEVASKRSLPTVADLPSSSTRGVMASTPQKVGPTSSVPCDFPVLTGASEPEATVGANSDSD